MNIFLLWNVFCNNGEDDENNWQMHHVREPHLRINNYFENIVLLYSVTDSKRNLTINKHSKSECSYHRSVYNLTLVYKNTHLDVIYIKKTLNKHYIMLHTSSFFLENKLEFQRAPYYHLPSFKEESNKKRVKFTNDTKSLHLSSDESEESSRCSFSVLSDELILKILENLDWRSLCRVSRVDKRLNRIAQDPHLYTYLKIEVNSHCDYNAIHTSFAFERSLFDYFTPRCENLRLLSLMGSHIEWLDFQKFLISRGRHLTHLRLSKCIWINDSTLSQIVEICQDLKELDLRLSPLTDEGLLCLENLQFLECLCLFCIDINIKTLHKILRRNRRIRHLAITRFTNCGFPYLSSDDFAVELKNFCPDLESISLFTGLLTSQGIDALADCKNLRKMRFEYCHSKSYDTYYGDSFYKLFSSCQRLEEINLRSFQGLTDYDLEALALCKNLKYLNVKRVTSLTNATCLKILLNCPKLKKISLSRNAIDIDETRNLFNQWIEKHSLHSLHVDLQLDLF